MAIRVRPGAASATPAIPSSISILHGNANQVFKWRRALKRGELSEPAVASKSLLPVVVAAPTEPVGSTDGADAQERSAPVGSIHIEFPGTAMISVERGADPRHVEGFWLCGGFVEARCVISLS